MVNNASYWIGVSSPLDTGFFSPLPYLCGFQYLTACLQKNMRDEFSMHVIFKSFLLILQQMFVDMRLISHSFVRCPDEPSHIKASPSTLLFPLDKLHKDDMALKVLFFFLHRIIIMFNSAWNISGNVSRFIHNFEISIQTGKPLSILHYKTT